MVKNLEEQADKLKEDRDVVEPFIDRLVYRLNQRFPGEDI
jgi:hypothetical protein